MESEKYLHVESAIQGQKRVVITHVYPQGDGGLFAIKRCIWEQVHVEADVFSDAHDQLSGYLFFRHEHDVNWASTPLSFLENDRWYATFSVEKIGIYLYTLKAWVDEYKTWQQKLKRKMEADQDISIDLLMGAEFIVQASLKANEQEKKYLSSVAKILQGQKKDSKAAELVFDAQFTELIKRYLTPCCITECQTPMQVVVDRPLANFSAWYEVFPRSWSKKTSQHGSFNDLKSQLPYIKKMGFDVIYLTPIHPIGRSQRKGKNNSIQATETDVGSPWAIGSVEGGHMDIHPQLGNFEDFENLIEAAHKMGIEFAMDFALQCSPDHPYLQNHPEWFKKRPDGTLQYAENPPKKYEDIYPFNFESSSWLSLWEECKEILIFWIRKGIKIFRVDNPHTKPFIFWEWLIKEIKKIYPEVIFLSEAFTRPKIMYHLAKLGFSQSYTYFTWRNTKSEIIQYFQELTKPPLCDFFRPSFWPNTPDILHEYLQKGGRRAFIIRFILAATLGNNYGIYGPAFELCIHEPQKIGSEEYLDSEKYEIRNWNLESSISISPLITRINQMRREHIAFQNMQSLMFHKIDNTEIICYSKHSMDFKDIIMVIVNLDGKYKQSGWVEVNHVLFDKFPDTYQVEDLLNGEKYVWHGSRNFVELDPERFSAHILHLRTIGNI